MGSLLHLLNVERERLPARPLQVERDGFDGRLAEEDRRSGEGEPNVVVENRVALAGLAARRGYARDQQNLVIVIIPVCYPELPGVYSP
ncbi:MAG: hypothetical protein BWY92_01766 [Firmicutes bacterium ADurb.BinA052]|nr:MAG: hypothetical protein BWY92_01766 [Firmicutes bacterium ADurb.BinA052]